MLETSYRRIGIYIGVIPYFQMCVFVDQNPCAAEDCDIAVDGQLAVALDAKRAWRCYATVASDGQLGPCREVDPCAAGKLNTRSSCDYDPSVKTNTEIKSPEDRDLQQILYLH